MSRTKSTYWLETGDTRIPITAGSALIGRSADCDVVLLDERVSRHHALVRVVDDGVEVIPLRPFAVTAGATPTDAARTLRDGDAIDIVGTRLVVRRTESEEPEVSRNWFVERDAGVLLRVGSERLFIGGGAEDQVNVAGWRARVGALELLGEFLVLEVLADDVVVGRPRDLGDLVTLDSGARIEHRGRSLRVVALPLDPSKPTRRPTLEELPSAVTLSLMPRGGQLTIAVGARVRKMYLSEKRCELVACLIQPPAPYTLGELIPDEVITARIWPGVGGTRGEVNTLVWRVRRDLAAAGLDDVPLLDRSGGGLRLCLAEGGRAAVTG